VYDHAHVGHARAMVAFDVMARRLLRLGYKVNFVRNYTDVDDKIINRAKEKGVPWLELAEEYIRSFEEDAAALNCVDPGFKPRATEYISQMIEDVAAIVAAGKAYVAEGDVFFDVALIEAYGSLSGRNLEDQEAGARVAVDARKRHPGDFALWKSAKPGEPSWPSPWGPGRPGWHIECSTMSARLLGPSFDIHGGGQDLIFPHHENELAQSAALGRPMASIWAHNGFVNIDNEKMSKSLGNFFTVKDVLKLYSPELLRYFLLSKHYRTPIEFSDEALKESGKAMERVYRALAASSEFLNASNTENVKAPEPDAEPVKQRDLYESAMNEDLNTAQALGHTFELVRFLNKAVDSSDLVGTYWATQYLRSMAEELGLWLKKPEVFFSESKSAASDGLGVAEIEDRIARRNDARARKDWAEADRLRKELHEMGVVLEDKAGQTTWRYA
jgi:cysteinyl-tRNA synthetase